MKMKFYLYLSLLFALTILTPLFAEEKEEKITKIDVTVKTAPKENFKDIQKLYRKSSEQQRKLNELSNKLKESQKQLKANQLKNISSINKKLQEETENNLSKLNDLAKRKTFELKTREQIVDYQGRNLDVWLMVLAIGITVLTVIIPIIFWIFSNKFIDKQTELQEKIEKEQNRIKGKSEELDDLIKNKKKEFNILIEDQEIKINKLIEKQGKEFNALSNKLKAKLESSGKKQSKLITEKADLFNKAYQAGRDGKHSEAIDLYNKLIKIEPNNHIAYNNRGVAYSDLDDNFKAIDDYSRCIDLKPDYSKTYLNQALAYGKQRKFDEAIKDYKKYIELEPDNMGGYTSLIEALIIVGNLDEADKYFTQVKKHKHSVQYESVFSMLKAIYALANNQDAKIELEKFNETLKNEVSLIWQFDELEGWLESPEFKLGNKIKKKIKEDVIKKYKARQDELRAEK